VITNSPGEYSIQLAKEFTKRGHTVKFAQFSLRHPFHFIREFQNADIIHVNYACHGLKPLVINKFFGIPYIFTVHGVGAKDLLKYEYGLSKKVDFFHVIEHKLTSLISRNARAVISISQFAASRLKKNYGIKTYTVYHGVDLNKFNPSISGRYIRKKLGLKNNPVMLWVGRFIPWKDPFTFLNAIPLILPKYPSAKFIMLGEGPLKLNIKSFVKNSPQLRSSVIFPAFAEKINEYYAAANVFAFTSICEGFGYVLTEAMACGIPVVASNQGSPPEVVGDAGLFFQTGDSNDLSQKILTVLSDKALARKMGQKGRKRVERRFRWDICARQIMNIYNKALVQEKK